MSVMSVEWGVFKKQSMKHSTAMRRFHRTSRKGMERIGAMMMREAQKKIKRRIVTDAMRKRLNDALWGQRAAIKSGDNVRMRNAKTRVRRIARTIEKRQSTTSKPGQPPIAHVPDAPFRSIRDIRFAATDVSALVGPAAGNQVNLVGSNRKTVPEILEKGGVVTIHEKSVDGENWFRRDLRYRRTPDRLYRTRRARYAARPFMRPMLASTQAKRRKILNKVFKRGAA